VLADEDFTRALIVTAHPDDVDFGAAGTIATWTAAGIEVTYCIVTDGDAGGFDHETPRSEIPRIRREEQVKAAALAGVHDVRFLGYRDGELTVTHDLRRDISRVIRQVRPDRMLVQSPERNWERIGASHPDHLHAGEAAMQAIYPDSRNPFAHPTLLNDEGLEAWTVKETWLMAHQHPDHFVDVTDVFDTKIAAILSHASQFADPSGIEPMVRGWTTHMAGLAGLPEGRLAEAFKVISTG